MAEEIKQTDDTKTEVTEPINEKDINAEVKPEIPKVSTDNSSLDINKLLSEIESENTKKLEEVKNEAIKSAQENMLDKETVSNLLSKVDSVYNKRFESLMDNFNKQLSEMNDKFAQRKGVVPTQSNPITGQNNYDYWKDPNIGNDAKVDTFLNLVKEGKFK